MKGDPIELYIVALDHLEYDCAIDRMAEHDRGASVKGNGVLHLDTKRLL